MTETAQQLVARLTGFTLGPWRTGTNNPYRVYDGGSQSVLHMDPPFNLAARYEANATLIAAAPDLHRELTAALAREAALRDALGGLGALPEGYCYCPISRDATRRDNEHTGECQAARLLLQVMS